MKNILTTAGVAAIAVAGIQTQCAAQAIAVDDSKWWQVSASLRGFYDDNYTIAPDDFARESFGFEVRPGVVVGHQGEQYIAKLSAIYSGRWFEDRDDEPWDHNFMVDANGEYQLSENHVLRLSDNFSYSSEPTLVDRGTAITFLRADGSNIRNLGDIKYVGQLAPIFGLEIGYGNTFYDFEQEGVGSFSSILDRVEHLLRAETRWTLTPTLAGIVGYWYEDVGFTADEIIGPGSTLRSDIRDSYSHYFVVGGDYTVSPHCFISARAGAQNVTYDNVRGEPDQWNGFGDISATFEYAEGSHFRVGGRYGRNRTDMVAQFPTALPGIADERTLTLDQETAVAYGVVSHKLTEQLTARGSAQLQFGTFNGGRFDDENEALYVLGLSLTYDLNQYLAIETGYNYDRLDSDSSNRTYSRNRVFLGLRGQF